MLVSGTGIGKWGIPKEILRRMYSPERNRLRRNTAEFKCLPKEDGSIPKMTPPHTPLTLFIYCCSFCPNLLILLLSFLYYTVELMKLTFNSSASQFEKEQHLSKLKSGLKSSMHFFKSDYHQQPWFITPITFFFFFSCSGDLEDAWSGSACTH